MCKCDAGEGIIYIVPRTEEEKPYHGKWKSGVAGRFYFRTYPPEESREYFRVNLNTLTVEKHDK